MKRKILEKNYKIPKRKKYEKNKIISNFYFDPVNEKEEKLQLTELFPNELMIEIVKYTHPETSIYFWTLWRCVSKLFKNLIELYFPKPEFLIFRFVLDESNNWQLWRNHASYPSGRDTDLNTIDKNNGKSGVNSLTTTFCLISLPLNYLTKEGKLRIDDLDKIQNFFDERFNEPEKKKLLIKNSESQFKYLGTLAEYFVLARNYKNKTLGKNENMKKEIDLFDNYYIPLIGYNPFSSKKITRKERKIY